MPAGRPRSWGDRDARVEALSAALRSLQAMLSADVTGDRERRARIQAGLRAGRLVVIREALRPAFADSVHAALAASEDWTLEEDYSHRHFHYRHHNLYDESRYPEPLRRCQEVFGSVESRRLIGEWSGRPCQGPTVVSASWYRPGDYSLPHSDRVSQGGLVREVAFVWHLTRQWQPGWGGELFWAPAGRYLSPGFNVLLLFAVRPDSLHSVTTVAPVATGRRLAVNGWWTGPSAADQGAAAPPGAGGEATERVEIV